MLQKIPAVILSGGSSRRMGEDKSFLTLNGIPFIEIITGTLCKIFQNIYISSLNPEKYFYLNIKVIKDEFIDFGPLSGIYSSIKFLHSEQIFFTSCDLPMINLNIIEQIIKYSEKDKINIASIKGRSLPVLGSYPNSIQDDLLEYLSKGNRKMLDFVRRDEKKMNEIDLSNFEKYLININTKDDYNKLINEFKS